MNNDYLTRLKRHAAGIREPENLFAGERLPRQFELPDNILVFFHNFTAPSPNAHGRYTVVVPFDRMIYFVEQQRVTIFPGTILLLPPHTVRFLHPESEGYERLFITFELKMPQKFVPEALLSLMTPEAWKRLWRFLRCYDQKESDEAAVGLFLFLKALCGTPADEGSATLLPTPVSRAIQFIGMNLARPLDNDMVAEAAGVSESYLRSLFRAHTGMTPARYVACQRLDAAKSRLLHTDRSVAEIAAGCGYANIFVFSAFFKRNTGLSPLEFRGQRNHRPGKTARG